MRNYARKPFIMGLWLGTVLWPMAIRADKPIAPPARMRSDLAAALGLSQEQTVATRAHLEEARKDWEKGVTIPPASEVGVPVPTNTLFIQAGERRVNRNVSRHVSLITPDDPDRVRRFYDERLNTMPGWRRSDEFGLFYLYDGALTLQELLSATIPVIEIKTVEPDHFFFMSIDPDQISRMKTLIQISYPCPKGSAEQEVARKIEEWMGEREGQLRVEGVANPSQQAGREAAEEFGMSIDRLRQIMGWD